MIGDFQSKGNFPAVPRHPSPGTQEKIKVCTLKNRRVRHHTEPASLYAHGYGVRLTVAISSRRMRRLAKARYSCALRGSLKRRLLWAFEFRNPTMPLNRNMIPF